ncbi:MAG: PQQ-binding-like beta-propeller repeat protein, partial [Planctomycetales bacterium]|nr:PQQ-binding-like beta-propeller repeat protein [Planctomycetales bacterium]
ELWKLSYGALGFSIVPRPVYGHGMIYFSTSFMRPEILAVRYSDSPTTKPYIAWRFSKQAPQKPSPLLVDDLLYFVGDKGGIATCLDARSGEIIWQERLGGNFSASPLLADGKIFFCSHEGVTTVVAPGKEFTKLASNTLDGSLMASPAAVDHSLFLRTDQALYQIQK